MPSARHHSPTPFIDFSRSLIRQLNAYSFQKVGKSDEVVFRHDDFRRGTETVTMMKRRRPAKRRPASEDSAAAAHGAVAQGDADAAGYGAPPAAASPSPSPAPRPSAGAAAQGSSPAVPASAPGAHDTAVRDTLIAALGCLQDMAAAMRHVAAAADADTGSSETLRSTAVASAATSAAALRHLLGATSASLPPHMRRALPAATGTPGPGGSAPASPVAELDAADRALSGVVAAVATGQLRAGADAPAAHALGPGRVPGMFGFAGSTSTRGEETYTSVEDGDLTLPRHGQSRLARRSVSSSRTAGRSPGVRSPADGAGRDGSASRAGSESAASAVTAAAVHDAHPAPAGTPAPDVASWGGAGASLLLHPVALPELGGDGFDDDDLFDDLLGVGVEA